MRINRKALRAPAAVLIVAFLIGTGPAGAQTPSPESAPAAPADSLDAAYLRQFFHDFISILTSPLRWSGADWKTFALIAGTGIAVHAFDQSIFDGIQKMKTPASTAAASAFGTFGHGQYLIAFLAGFYATGGILNDGGLRTTALLGVESFLTMTALVFILKSLVGRARPYMNESTESLHPFSTSNGYASFPSGDAATAFAVASVIAGRSKSLGVDIVAYGLAGLAAFFRVHDGKHWPSDVFLGSALGIAVGSRVISLHKPGTTNAPRLSFELGARRTSVSLWFTF
jgi:membrane-associated phospholipid phosphatase